MPKILVFSARFKRFLDSTTLILAQFVIDLEEMVTKLFFAAKLRSFERKY